ncbi:SMI1/KNR4 family protein [Hymenobacter sp. H14-R3]|uniref:SMI1/KNR4 family protein n=1 Tax=Hymenobacter sp. H14-R3 TaxID=3046308 RepID=UPI0024B9B4D7|nr:SMI1/KNR4 family protein [Hymenobacter sp. H14-R3]MDJ0364636.1 SMI1/KNR4 family protein [Hymenobacter sp. H14-R3]
MTTSAIEQQHGFEYPALYKQLDQDGMLDVGQYGPDWATTVLPKLRDNPTLLLFSSDFELLNLAHASEVTADLAAPDDYRQIKPAYKFIAFAQNGAGDYFCLLPTAQQANDIPVIFLWHDANEATFLAKNLQDFIFRRILTDMAEQDTYNKISDEEFRENLTATLKTHGRYLTEQQRTIATSMLLRPLISYEHTECSYTETRRGLLTATELGAMLTEIIGFAQLDVSFEYAAD